MQHNTTSSQPFAKLLVIRRFFGRVATGVKIGWWEFENQMFNLAIQFNSSTKVQLTTSAPILAMQC